MPERLKSRKFWIALMMIGLFIAQGDYEKAFYTAIAYISGQSVQDAMGERAKAIASKGMARLSALLVIVAVATLALFATGCRTLTALQEFSREAERKATAMYDLVKHTREECAAMPDPRPDYCQEADAIWESVKATAERLGVR